MEKAGLLSCIALISIVLLGCKENFKEINIGDQTWMAENLNVDKFRNGDPITRAKTEEEWKAASRNEQPAWCYYDNDSTNGQKYGKLYNWYAVSDPRGLAPKGWHVPNDTEWTQLVNFLGGEDAAGLKMKSLSGWGLMGWDEDGNGNNESGFSGLPGGRINHFGDSFQYLGCVGYWWSSTEDDDSYHGDDAWYFFLMCDDTSRDDGYYGRRIHRHSWYKGAGFSIRCIKN